MKKFALMIFGLAMCLPAYGWNCSVAGEGRVRYLRRMSAMAQAMVTTKLSRMAGSTSPVSPILFHRAVLLPIRALLRAQHRAPRLLLREAMLTPRAAM